MGQIIRVNPNAMATNQPGLIFMKIPFGSCRVDNVFCVDAQAMEDQRQFIHERDVEIALDVFNYFFCFCCFDIGSTKHPGFTHGGIDGRNMLERFGIHTRNNLNHFIDRMFVISRIRALG